MEQIKQEKYRIMIVDDEPFVRDILLELLTPEYDCTTASSAAEAMHLAEVNRFELVLTDIDLGDMSGVDLVPLVRAELPDAVVVIISGNQDIDHAIAAMRAGAFDYVRKPFDLDIVEFAVKRALNHHKLLAEKRQYETHLEHLVRRRTDELSHLAYHDPLTNLPNRELFVNKLEQALVRSNADARLAILKIALDGFDKIQDTLGHSSTAIVLKEVGLRLSESVGNAGIVSRMEGDEFALLFSDFQADHEVVECLKELTSAIKHPIIIENHEIFLTASIGIGFFNGSESDPVTLLKNTSTALHRAKEEGGNTHRFYTDGMDREAFRRFTIENGLRQAIDRSEIEVLYQPKVNVESGKVSGLEALVRWHHPEYGDVSPAEFIPMAEESGIIIALGEWVLKRACIDAEKLRSAGFDLNLAVNLSPKQLQLDDFTNSVVKILNETGFPAEFLNLEITESSIMKDADSAIDALSRLKKIGIKISLDDFGTGYSSFSHLKRLPIDVLKIDKSFIRDVTTDADDASLTMAMVTLGKNLRLRVVAEGVETLEQLKFLNLLQCDEYQGFYFCEPKPAAEILSLLSSN